MTKQSMVRMLRIHLNDEQSIGWEFDEELIDFLDRATAFLSNMLITMKHNSMIKPITIKGQTQLPDDYAGFVGRLPIRVFGGTAVPYGKVDKATGPRWRDPNINKVNQQTWRDPQGATEPSWEELTQQDEFNAYYWARLPYPSTYNEMDTLPYSIEFAAQIVDIARMLALNKNEYELTQDLNLFSQVQAALGAVVKVDEQ